ncbi:glycoside hydrolase domain-containing protein [Mucilaginibacter sp. P25]|uniref:glycoside hydrolase domain-containing protein n=1 Tax=Mucilaginibacter sp. P25 TaxID=3423945 RepID=UPI003D7B2B79
MKKQFLAITFLLSGFAASAQKVPYTNCDKCWLADSLGNHRVVLTFNGTGKVAKAVINWRRRDNEPENKRIIIEDAKTKQKITNVKIGAVNRESGELYFEPTSGKGTYFVYYMPYKNEGRSNYPKGVYLKPENTASAEWLSAVNGKQAPLASVKEFQSIDAFNSFYPMEVIATNAETEALLSKHKSEAFLVFPEDRMNSIRMTKDLPQRWIELGPQNKYTGEAARGENFAFQQGIYALKDIENVQVTFSDLKSVTGKVIPASALFCINTGGTTYDAKPLTKVVNVAKGDIQALWCGVDVPAAVLPSVYTGKATVSINGKPAKTIALSVKVNSKISKDGGVSEPYKMTRLGWLNSTMAQQNTVIAPYTPLEISGNTISLLGRKVEVNKDGFPKQIQTYFTPEMTEYAATPNNLLTEGIHFHFINAAGKKINLKSQGVQFTKKEAGTVQWIAISANDSLQMDVTASLEFDGFMAYTVKVKALQDVSLKDVTMHIPFKKDFAKYMMGLGQKGGYRPENFEWKWDVAYKNQDGAWIGNVNGGLQYSLRDEKYVSSAEY